MVMLVICLVKSLFHCIYISVHLLAKNKFIQRLYANYLGLANKTNITNNIPTNILKIRHMHTPAKTLIENKMYYYSLKHYELQNFQADKKNPKLLTLQ